METQPSPGIQGKIFYGETFEALQKSVNDWLSEVDVHVYEMQDAVELDPDSGWIACMTFYCPSVISHRSCTVKKKEIA